MWKPLALARQSLLRGSLTLFFSKVALAQTPLPATPGSAPSFSVAVERDDVAVSCPDGAWFEGRIASHAGKAGHAGTYKVLLGKRGDTWQARIQRWDEARDQAAAERVLQDRSTACQPLAEAVALTVAILADDLAQQTVPEPAPVEPAPPPKVPPPTAPPALELDRGSGAKVWVGAGGGVAMSFISPIAPQLGFGLALDTRHFRQGLRLMMTTEQKFELAPGRVVVQAWLATLFSCLQLNGERVGGALCGVADGSMLRASAEGFDSGTPSTRANAAFGLEAQPSWYVLDRYRISAVLGLLMPVTRESFSVIGKGVAYRPPPFSWRILVFSEIGAF